MYMQTSLIKQIREGLLEKRDTLEQWQVATPESKKEIELGPVDESAVVVELQVIDTALEKMEEGTFGICEVCHDHVDDELLQMDYTACVCLSHYSETELRELESELELSQSIQRALLPTRVPSIPGYEIAAFSRPAQIVTGDYFDFLQFEDGTHGFVVADISGHGMSAAMLMTSLQTVFHTLTPETDSPVDVLSRINRLYIHNINITTYATVFFARLDPASRVFSYASAGHNPPLLHRRSTHETAWLKPTGPAIGLIDGHATRLEQVQLVEGDVLILYTDGIIEAVAPQGSDQFGYERLLELVHENEGLSANELTQKIRHAVNDFTQGAAQADDITIVVCNVR